MKSFTAEVYKARRQELKSILGTGQVLFFGNQETGMNFKDNWYHFRQDSTLLYYTGISQPNVHLLLDIDHDEEVLYGNELSIDDIIWTGPLPSLSEIASSAGIQKVKPLKNLEGDIYNECRFLPAYRSEHNLLLGSLLNIEPHKVNDHQSEALVRAVIQQRNIKEEREVKEMDIAVNYSYDMHMAVMKSARAGMREHDLVAIASAIAYQHNVAFSYPAILTKRGEVLHNHDHTGLLQNGDMVLYDGGCESPMYYAGDITRTFPVGGKWSTLQRELYDVVHTAYTNSVTALKPGITFKEVHLLACRSLTIGLKELGFMKGDVDEAVASGAHTMFFQCGLGHMIGLDVHDMENLGEPLVGYSDSVKKGTSFGLKSLRLGRMLEKGHALTVEPGIYIIPELIELRKSEKMYEDFINYSFLEKHKNVGGIRLEDNFLITDSGSKVIGNNKGVPESSKEVEDFMRP